MGNDIDRELAQERHAEDRIWARAQELQRQREEMYGPRREIEEDEEDET